MMFLCFGFAIFMFNFFRACLVGVPGVKQLIPLGVLVALIVGLMVIRLTKNERQEVKRIEIYSLGLNEGAVNAQSFYLGRNGAQYLYYIGDSISGFNLESIPASKATIKYTNDKPFVIINQIKTTTLISSSIEIESYELYIPKGSIVEDYKIDL